MLQREKRNFVSPNGHVIYHLLYKSQWNTKSRHERHRMARVSCVTIATVIFSRVKITCYLHVWRYHVFARKFTWYFIGVYIIENHNRWVSCSVSKNSTAYTLGTEGAGASSSDSYSLSSESIKEIKFSSIKRKRLKLKPRKTNEHKK